jgi:hypothetical protein
MRRSVRFLAITLPLLLILSGAALANTCNNFSVYTCAKHTNDIVHVGGGVASGQSVGILLNSNMFNITTANGDGGSDVIILAAFANGAPTGTLNGIGFTSVLGSFPEGGATGAITDSLQGLGFCGTTCNLSFGYVDLGTALATHGSVSITAKGVPAGTVFYAEVLNSKGQIVYITPNSEAGILGRGTSPVPEPGTISLMITGLCGIAGGAWRKLRG